jgi:hypothetical protein
MAIMSVRAAIVLFVALPAGLVGSGARGQNASKPPAKTTSSTAAAKDLSENLSILTADPFLYELGRLETGWR